MAATINPAVSRVTLWRGLLHVAFFIVGAALGAALAFVVVASLAAGTEALGGRESWVVLAGLVTALAVARDLGANAPVPYRDVQVPQVLRYLMPPSLVALSYGTHLGVGFLTRYTYSSHVAFMMTLPLVLVDPLVVVGAILAFALGKAAVLVAFFGSSADEVSDIVIRHPTWSARGIRGVRLASAMTSTIVIVSALQMGGVI